MLFINPSIRYESRFLSEAALTIQKEEIPKKHLTADIGRNILTVDTKSW